MSAAQCQIAGLSMPALACPSPVDAPIKRRRMAPANPFAWEPEFAVATEFGANFSPVDLTKASPRKMPDIPPATNGSRTTAAAPPPSVAAAPKAAAATSAPEAAVAATAPPLPAVQRAIAAGRRRSCTLTCIGDLGEPSAFPTLPGSRSRFAAEANDMTQQQPALPRARRLSALPSRQTVGRRSSASFTSAALSMHQVLAATAPGTVAALPAWDRCGLISEAMTTPASPSLSWSSTSLLA
mmetsp:Transcript_24229/g.71927  ORF Transcript_24229/g.71927 Transcript_24229/m.71927 type:complete len:240 (-) Transcript_24229:2608-3327(-)